MIYDEKMVKIIARMLELDNNTVVYLLNLIEANKIKYLITFDMGCGNSSAAVSNLENNPSPNELQLSIWDDLDIFGKHTKKISIPTLLSYDDDQEPVIGRKAFDYSPFLENFKQLPTVNNLSYHIEKIGRMRNVSLRMAWKNYFSKVYSSILLSSKSDFKDINQGNSLFVVAHPASIEWTRELGNFRNMIAEATMLPIEHIITFSEAKAAMQFMRFAKFVQEEDLWRKGVVVVDLGASTIDVMYLAYGQKRPIEFSITLAGRNIDFLLGHYILTQLMPKNTEILNSSDDFIPTDTFFNNQNNFNVVGLNRTKFCFIVRLVKEELCNKFNSDTTATNISAYYPNNIRKTLQIDANVFVTILNTKRVGFVCPDSIMRNYISPNNNGNAKIYGTWNDIVQRFLEYVFGEIKTKTNNTVPCKIVLTGGTANVVGIKSVAERARNTVGWDKNTTEILVYNDALDYERTVPYGSYSYVNNVITHAKEMVEFPPKLKNAVCKDLIENLPGVLAKDMKNVLYPKYEKVYREWEANGINGDKSLAGLSDELARIATITISEEKAQNMFNNAVNNLGSDKLKNTLGLLGTFLSHLTVSNSYSHQIDMSALNNLRLDDQRLRTLYANIYECVVVETTGVENIIASIQNVLNTLANKFREQPQPTQLAQSVRTQLTTSFINLNANPAGAPVKSLENIIAYDLGIIFKRAFQDDNDYGVSQGIIQNLETDINQAMFLG